MKLKLAAAALAVLVAALPAAAQDAAAQRDRADAVRYLEATRHAFLKSLDGVTEAQWKFKASPETWSIAEVAEHIALSETAILGIVTAQVLQAPPLKPGEGIADEK